MTANAADPGAKAGGGATEGTTGGGEGTEGTEGTEAVPLAGPETAAAAKASATLTYQDVRVVQRKAVLKGGRFELSPFTGVSVNDIMIRHYVFGADVNFFMTDAIWVGLQGSYYIKQLTEQETLVGLQYNRIPTLNRYLYGGALNFGYVPVYGKFALFNRPIIQWEIFISGGVGVTKTEIIPVTPGDAIFQNISLTPNFGGGGRFFILDWLTINWAVRDYIVVDKFEPPNRHNMYMSATDAKNHADNQIVNNIIFYVGAGFFLPTKFQYKTPR